MSQPDDDGVATIHGVPLVVDDGFRLAPRAPVCHGYANCCVCTECIDRAADAQPDDADEHDDADRVVVLQPWEPRPPRTHHREAA